MMSSQRFSLDGWQLEDLEHELEAPVRGRFMGGSPELLGMTLLGVHGSCRRDPTPEELWDIGWRGTALAWYVATHLAPEQDVLVPVRPIDPLVLCGDGEMRVWRWLDDGDSLVFVMFPYGADVRSYSYKVMIGTPRKCPRVEEIAERPPLRQRGEDPRPIDRLGLDSALTNALKAAGLDTIESVGGLTRPAVLGLVDQQLPAPILDDALDALEAALVRKGLRLDRTWLMADAIALLDQSVYVDDVPNGDGKRRRRWFLHHELVAKGFVGAGGVSVVIVEHARSTGSFRGRDAVQLNRHGTVSLGARRRDS
jgi:hypothetical protein